MSDVLNEATRRLVAVLKTEPEDGGWRGGERRQTPRAPAAIAPDLNPWPLCLATYNIHGAVGTDRIFHSAYANRAARSMPTSTATGIHCA
jgi:hypothetical protein